MGKSLLTLRDDSEACRAMKRLEEHRKKRRAQIQRWPGGYGQPRTSTKKMEWTHSTWRGALLVVTALLVCLPGGVAYGTWRPLRPSSNVVLLKSPVYHPAEYILTESDQFIFRGTLKSSQGPFTVGTVVGNVAPEDQMDRRRDFVVAAPESSGSNTGRSFFTLSLEGTSITIRSVPSGSANTTVISLDGIAFSDARGRKIETLLRPGGDLVDSLKVHMVLGTGIDRYSNHPPCDTPCDTPIC